MKYHSEIRAAQGDPERLEATYQAARQAGDRESFRKSVIACYEQSPDDVLYAAWYYRLRGVEEEERARGGAINWKLAVPLSVLLGLIYWLLSGRRLELADGMPYAILIWAPIGACFVIAFLALTSARNRRLALFSALGLLVAGGYVTLFVAMRTRPHYQILMSLHLPLLSWVAAGIALSGLRSDHQERFAFLIKSVEVFVTAGLFTLAGGAFAGITIGMFEALDISLSEEIMRLLFAGGFGLIPVLAVASGYDPHLRPIAQRFQQGIFKVISTLMRLLLPLSLLVLVIYIVVIPFRFMEPFRKREVLIVYNAMLFAVMGLLIGATPVRDDDLSPKVQRVLRAGILAVAVLATVVSLYAMSATVYRTVLGGITINRLAVIGWNVINIGLLVSLIYKQMVGGLADWVRSLQTVFGWGTAAYALWGGFLTLAIPLLFREG